jgi:carnitine O-acetyltransferase
MCDWILSSLAGGKIDHGQATRASIPAPEKLEWSVSSSTVLALSKAESNFKELIDSQQLEVYIHRFGAKMAKSLSVSPDAVRCFVLIL